MHNWTVNQFKFYRKDTVLCYMKRIFSKNSREYIKYVSKILEQLTKPLKTLKTNRRSTGVLLSLKDNKPISNDIGL